MPITLVTSGSTPSDTGSNATATITPTLPTSSMLDGDLIIIAGMTRTTGSSVSVSTSGGLTWVQYTTNGVSYTNNTTNIFSAVYLRNNYTGNPTVSYANSINTTLFYVIFRPPNQFNYGKEITQTFSGSNTGGYTWINSNSSLGNLTTGSTTVGCDVTGFPNNASYKESLAFCLWTSNDDNTWGNLSGTGFEKTSLSAQYRNLAGSDTSMTIAYSLTGLSSVGLNGVNITQDQLTLGPDDTISLSQNFIWYNQSGVVSPGMGHPFMT